MAINRMVQYILPQLEEQEHFFQSVLKEAEVIAYDDLGTEAIRKLRVENFPVIVVIDNQGNNLYETAVEKFQKIK